MTHRRDRRPPRRVGGRLALTSAAILIGLAALIGSAAPAAAVTPRPTDYRSTVQSVEPSAPITVAVVGADTLLELRAEPGHEVVVAGYGDEPYLRIQRDGTTQVNQRSPAVSLNRSRDADVGDPNLTAVDGDPDWKTIGDGGQLLWHDHRIHAGDAAAFEGVVDWAVPVTVDGTPVVVSGQLERVEPSSSVPFVLLAVAVAVATWFAGHRRPRRVAGAALLLGSGLAAATGFVEWASLPAEVARSAGVFLLPLAAAVCATVGLAIRRRMPAMVALLGSASLLAGWLAFRWSILTRSVLISDLAPAADRAAYAVVLGTALAAAGLTVQWAGSGEDPDAIDRDLADRGLVRRGRARRTGPVRPATSPRAAG